MFAPLVRSTPAAVFGVAVCALLACDDNPTAPSQNAPPPAAVSIIRLDLVAPEAIRPETSVPLTARALKSDGSTEDVTGQVQWSSSDTRVLHVASDGRATAGQPGEARVTATLEPRTASRDVLVLPEGTFRLRGDVRDAGIPLSGVNLVVIAGTGEGLTAETDGAGAFALYGVAGSVRIQGKKDGYHNLVADFHVARHDTVALSMAADGTRPRPTGAYTLSLTAASCQNGLRADARQRTYAASLEQQGTRVTVRLHGADFILTNGYGNAFSGVLHPDGRADFSIGNWGFYYYGYFPFLPAELVERLADGSTLLIAGFVQGRAEADRITGTLNGYFSVGSRSTPPFWPNLTHCYSPEHRFDLRRR